MKTKLFEVTFTAKIHVAADNMREAAESAAVIVDNPHCYVSSIFEEKYAYPKPIDLTENEGPSLTAIAQAMASASGGLSL